MPRRPNVPTESFTFDVDDWTFDYGFHVDVDAPSSSPLGICWEGHYLRIRGPLRSKTKRRNCSAVMVTFMPGNTDPASWKRDRKGFGSVSGVRGRVLIGHAGLPASSFHSLLTALSAGKVRRCYLGIRDVSRGAGIIHSFHTVVPDEEHTDE